MRAVRNNLDAQAFEDIVSFANKFKAHDTNEWDLSQMMMWCTEDVPYGTPYANGLYKIFDRIFKQL